MRSPKAKVEANTADLRWLPGGGGISFGSHSPPRFLPASTRQPSGVISGTHILADGISG